MSAEAPIRFAVLGTRGHALRVAVPTLRSMPLARLLGGVGSTREGSAAFAREAGLDRIYESIDAVMADPQVDAVWICSPNHLHAAQVAQCAAAGKHVLVEKPLAVGRAAAQQAADAARRAGVVLQVDCQHRFRPAHLRIRELILGGAIGRVGYLRIHRFWPYPYFPDMPPDGPPSWRRDAAESGGWVINDIGSHLIDLALWITGQTATVAGAVMASQKFQVGTEDSAAVLLALANGGIGSIEASCVNDSPGSRIELYGSHGWLRADDTLSGPSVITRSGAPSEAFEAFGMLDTYRASVHDFIRAIRGDAHIGADAKVGIEVAAITEAALKFASQSARQGVNPTRGTP
ncbi:MAG: Gfo/Idh/MocA family oxidoreductase [Pseudomonadota bacterium]